MSRSIIDAFNPQARATLINSTVTGNTALADVAIGTGYAGGIENNGILSLVNSSVTGNSANNGGAGIENEGTLTLTNSAIADNRLTEPGGRGGGDPATDGGAGLLNRGMLIGSNCTIVDNVASGPDNHGGGVLDQGSISDNKQQPAQVDLSFCTISGNSAPGGADLAVEDVSIQATAQPSQYKITPVKQFSPVKVRNSIIAGSATQSGQDIEGTLISNGYNLFLEHAGASFDPATQTQHETDRLVSANTLSTVFATPPGLRNNGGPTETYALAQGSPASDAIPLHSCQIDSILNRSSHTYTDQRGMKRPDEHELACDIGAYEYEEQVQTS